MSIKRITQTLEFYYYYEFEWTISFNLKKKKNDFERNFGVIYVYIKTIAVSFIEFFKTLLMRRSMAKMTKKSELMTLNIKKKNFRKCKLIVLKFQARIMRSFKETFFFLLFVSYTFHIFERVFFLTHRIQHGVDLLPTTKLEVKKKIFALVVYFPSVYIDMYFNFTFKKKF